MKQQGKDASELIANGKVKGDSLKSHEDQLRDVETRLNELILYIPNVPTPRSRMERARTTTSKSGNGAR